MTDAANAREDASAEFKAAVIAAWRLDSVRLIEIADAAGMTSQGIIQLLNRAKVR